MAHLVVQYANSPAKPRIAPIEAMLMIDPWPAEAINGSMFAIPKKVPSWFTL
jgi:hypothetical protein